MTTRFNGGSKWIAGIAVTVLMTTGVTFGSWNLLTTLRHDRCIATLEVTDRALNDRLAHIEELLNRLVDLQMQAAANCERGV